MPELIGQMLQVKPAAPSALADGIPQGASDAIRQALDPTPSDRFGDAAAFGAALGTGG